MTSLNLLTEASFDTASIDTLYLNTLEPLDNNNVQVNCELVVNDNIDISGRYRINGINQYNNTEIDALLDIASKWAYTGINTLYNENITGNVAINTTFCPTNVSLAVSGTLSVDDIISRSSTMNIACNTGTTSLNIACGNALQSINIGGNGTTFQTTINIGGQNDIVNINGTMNFITTTNVAISDKTIVINSGAVGSATARNAGIWIRDSNIDNQGYIQTNSNGQQFQLKAPENGFILSTPALTTNSTTIINQGNQTIVGELTSTRQFISAPINNDEGIILRNPSGVSSGIFKFQDSGSNTKARMGVAPVAGAIHPSSLAGDFIARSENNSIYLWNTNNNNNYLKLDTNGNVGINKQPSYKLDISGSINISGGTYNIAGVPLNTSNIIVSGPQYSQWGVRDYTIFTTGLFYSSGVNIQNGLVIGDNSRNPIGDRITVKGNNPFLELINNGGGNNSIAFINNLDPANKYTQMYMDSDDTLWIRNFTNGATFNIIGGGNIEIGTPSSVSVLSGDSIYMESADQINITATNEINISNTVGDINVYPADEYVVWGKSAFLNDASYSGYLFANNIEGRVVSLVIDDIDIGTNSLNTLNVNIGNNINDVNIQGKLLNFGNARGTNATFAQRISTSGLFVSNNANIVGNLHITGNFSVTGNMIVKNIDVGDYLIVGGNATFGGNLQVNNIRATGSIASAIGNFNTLNITSDGYVKNNFHVDSRISIGNFNSPVYELHLQGDPSPTICLDNQGIVGASDMDILFLRNVAGNQYGSFGYNLDGDFLLLNNLPTGRFNIDSNLRVIKSATFASSVAIGGNCSITGNMLANQLTRQFDLRQTSPAQSISANSFRFGFGSWGNNNASPFSDNIILNSWSDGSGGNTNMLALRKDAIGMRVYQEGFGLSNVFQTYEDVIMSDPNSANVTITGGLNIGNSSTFSQLITVSGLNVSQNVRITGTLIVNGNATFNNNIRSNTLNIAGNAVIGGPTGNIGNTRIGEWNGSSNFASFIHNSAPLGTTNYALLQENGTFRTFLNSATTPLSLRVENNDLLIIGTTGINTTYPRFSLNTSSGNATSTSLQYTYASNVGGVPFYTYLIGRSMDFNITNGNVNLASDGSNRSNVGIGLSQFRIDFLTNFNSGGTVGITQTYNSLIKATIENNGRLGLGITAPNYPLHIHRDTVSTDVRIQLSDASSTSGAARGFHIIKSTSQQAFLVNYENQPMYFYTNGLERGRFEASGNYVLQNSIQFPNGGNSNLGHYEEVLHSTTFRTGTSGGTTATISLKCIRVGRNVTITVPNFLLTCTSTDNYIQNATSNLVPSNFRPVNATTSLVTVGTSAGTVQAGRMDVLTSGEIRFYATVAGGNYGGLTNNNGLSVDATISYNIN